MALYYIFPKEKNISFSLISRKHIQYLSRKTKVYDVDESMLDNLMWPSGKKILLHPILYVTIGDREDLFEKRIRRLKKLLDIADRLGGFETCDSDSISKIAVEVLNNFDLVVVPSTFARNVLLQCGVKSEVVTVPHGVPEAFMTPKRDITSKNLLPLADLKKKKNLIYVLFFLMHSGYRKGADIVYNVMKRIQERYKNVILVVKRGSIIDPYLAYLRKLRTVEVAGFLAEDELRQLYDLCDVVLCPSRGGGFELNALEGIARGVPTIVPEAGCFLDYCSYAITVSATKRVKVFEKNPIHVGYGWEVDQYEFYNVLMDVINNLEEYKAEFREHMRRIWWNYNWSHICDMLFHYLKKFGFIS